VAPFDRERQNYLLPALAMLSLRTLSLVMLSLIIVLSIAGAGAIAGAEVSAVAASSFLAVQAASTRTAATRARRFIYNLLSGAVGKSPVRARSSCSFLARAKIYLFW
jgi:hypothetical protein